MFIRLNHTFCKAMRKPPNVFNSRRLHHCEFRSDSALGLGYVYHSLFGLTEHPLIFRVTFFGMDFAGANRAGSSCSEGLSNEDGSKNIECPPIWKLKPHS
jgi:hypothetical protein